MTDKNDDNVPTAEQVLRFLAANPDFLKQIAAPDAKQEASDGKIVDLTPAIARRARNEARRIGLQNKSILNLAAENMVNWQRLHHAALALLAAGDVDQLFHVIATEFPSIFDLESCQLISASAHFQRNASKDGPIFCPDDVLASLTGGKSLVLGAPESTLCALLGIAPASVAIIALPDRLVDPVAETLLVLCGQKKSSFTPDLSSDLLVLLAELVGVALTARLGMSGEVNVQ
tara:strand:+ start:320 stop:1015 length:696 start_codon:yes stop_codon:yes gene_type:complete